MASKKKSDGKADAAKASFPQFAESMGKFVFGGKGGERDGYLERRKGVVELCAGRFMRLYAKATRKPVTERQSAYVCCALFLAHDGNKNLLNVDALANLSDVELFKDAYNIVNAFDGKTGTLKNGFVPMCGFEAARDAHDKGKQEN